MKRNELKINQRLKMGLEIAIKDEFFVYIPFSRAIEKHKISTQEVAKSLTSLSKKYKILVRIAVLNEKEDYPLACKIARQTENAEIFVVRDEKDAALRFRGAKFIISSRYHGTLFAITMGIPTLSVSNDPKIYSLCKDYSLCPAFSPSVLKKPVLLCAKAQKTLDYHAQNSLKIYNSIQKFTAETEKSLNELLVTSN